MGIGVLGLTLLFNVDMRYAIEIAGGA